MSLDLVHLQRPSVRELYERLGTGQPRRHGDREDDELVYNIEDERYPLLPTATARRASEQVDPAQKKARTNGRSPLAMLTPTFADTLVARHGTGSKVFSVAGKDRSAVAMAGKTGVVVGVLHDRFVHVPSDLIVSRKKRIDPDGLEWAAVLAATGQPAKFE